MNIKQKKYRVAILASHIVNYKIDLYKELNRYPDIETMVYFCSDFGIRIGIDKTSGVRVKWYDKNILDNLPHKFLKNYSLNKKHSPLDNFIGGAINPGIFFEILRNRFDCVIIDGYMMLTNWFAFLAAWVSKTPILFRGDLYLLNPRKRLVQTVKRLVLPLLFKHINVFLTYCNTNADYYKHYGVPEYKLFFVPYSVNNERLQNEYKKLTNKKGELRKEKKINPDLPVILYVAKMILRKRPMDLMKSFEILQEKIGSKAQLVFVGDGPEKSVLEDYASRKKISNVYFVGFKNHKEVSKYYALADIFVLPSEIEVWGLVVNEAMNFSLPIITTDMVGAGCELVKDNENGFVYQVGDINKLADYLLVLIENKNFRNNMGKNSLKIINNWSYKKAVVGIVEAFKFLKNPRVIVAQPGSHHLWQTAVGLQKGGLLKYYATGVYYKPDRFPYFLINLFPEKFKNKIDQQLKRRLHEELDEAKVKTFGFYEWLYIINGRFLKSNRLSNWIINHRNRHFSQKIGKLAAKEAKILWAGMDSALEAFKIAKEKGVKCILDQFIGHPISLNKVLDEEEKNWSELKGLIKEKITPEKIERLVKEIELANLIVAGSEFVKKTLTENGVSENKIAVIPYGADTKIFFPQQNKNKSKFLNLLFVGNISARKGCHYLLEAIKQLNHQNIKLTMIGEMKDKYFLNNFGNYFKWLPPMPHNQIPSYYNEADVFVFPSLFEGSALVIYEALAAGLPVITTHNSGSIVKNGKNGFIVPIRDVKAIKEKILLLYNNKELCDKMSGKAHETAEQYSWKKYHENVAQFIKLLEK